MLLLFAAIALLSLYIAYRWIELQLFALTWDIEATIAAADATRDT